jgi:hypothetical protein
VTSAQPDWGGYLAQFHAQRSGITEALLSCATDTAGRTPYGWLAAVVPTRGSVLDLACGSAPTGNVSPPRSTSAWTCLAPSCAWPPPGGSPWRRRPPPGCPSPTPPRDALRWARLLVALREPGLRYPNDGALARADEVVAAAGRLLDGLYLPGVPDDRVAAARRLARGWVGQRTTLPIRRLVARG